MKSKAKYRIVFIMLFILIYTLAVPALAVEQQRFSLPELKMNISVDDSFAVITRDTEKNDPAFEAADLDYDSTMKNFLDSGIYLEGISADGGYILTVSMNEDTNSQAVVSYGRLSGDEMESLRSGFLTNSIYTGAQVTDVNGNIYIALPFVQTRGDVTLYGMQYNTVENGMNINITLYTALAPLGDNTIWIIEDAVNSIEFTERTESVSSFNAGTVIFWLLFAIIIIAAISFILTGLVRRKKLPVNGGFDSPENPLFKFLHKKQPQSETREQIIENINNGGDYDVFKDANTPLTEEKKIPFFKKGKKK